MNRMKVLVTVTDGVDNTDDGGSYRPKLVSRLRGKGVFSLSCGIGTVGVEHDGLASIAHSVGGHHMVVRDSDSIMHAIGQVTARVHTRVLQVAVSRDEQPAQVAGVVARRAVRIPVDLLVLIDRSWSMLGMVQYEGEKDDWSGDRQKLPNTKAAVTRLIESLDHEHDRVAVASFCEQYSLLRGLTSDFQSCMSALHSLDGGYGTALYKSMYLAAGDLES